MEERELTLLLAIDVSPSMHYYGLRKKKINTVLLTAATLAFSALQNNDKVGLVLFADNIVQHYVPPAKGRKHVLRILRDIVEQPTLLSDKKYAETWFLSRIVKRKSALFFFVDMFYTFSYQEMQLLARKHDLSALLVEDDFFHKLPDRGTLLLQNREEKQHFWTRFSQSKWKNALEQQYQDRCAWQMQQWNQVKAQYSELRVSDDVFMQLKRFFKKRKRH